MNREPSLGPLEPETITQFPSGLADKLRVALKPKTSSMTLVLREEENTALEELAEKQDLSKAGVMRQALRLYQMVYRKNAQGLTMAFIDKDGKPERILLMGMPDPAAAAAPQGQEGAPVPGADAGEK